MHVLRQVAVHYLPVENVLRKDQAGLKSGAFRDSVLRLRVQTSGSYHLQFDVGLSNLLQYGGGYKHKSVVGLT